MRTKATPAVPLPSLGEVNDLGKPWRFEEDGLTVTRSAIWSPPGCHPTGCGLKLYTDADGKLVKVEGDENHPTTQGRLCVRCIALQDYVYNPDRVLHPMKRDPKFRGQPDKWEQISYDEALDLFEEKYNEITGKYGRESMVLFSGTGREGGTFNPYSSCVFRTPQLCYSQSGYACYIPRATAAAAITGIVYPELDYAACLPLRYDDPEYEAPEVIVLWGKEPLKSNPDGLFGHAVIDLAKRGSKIISIDPRVNWVSTRAEIHLRLRPGTDAALGMAMLQVIVDEGLYDHEFVERWCYGFDELVERLHDPEKGISPERAAEICGLDADDIRAAARLYAKAKSANILWGLATDQKRNGIQHGQVILDLAAITGNIDNPGGQLAQGHEELWDEKNYGYGDLEDYEGFKANMIGMDTYPLYCNLVQSCHADLTLKALETDEPRPLRIGFYMGNNLLPNTSMEPERWMKAINRSLEFCATIECFMTPSAQATCDLIIPLATGTEKIGTVFNEYGVSPLINSFCNPAIEHCGESHSDFEFAYDMGKRLNPEFFAKYDKLVDFVNDFRFGQKYDYSELHTEVYLQQENEYYKYKSGKLRPDGQPGFATPTGRIELWSTMFQQFGEDPLPYYFEPDYSPVQTPELYKEYPFVLTTGARTYAFFHSEQRQVPYLRELNPDPLVEVNPADAARLGIADGQWCRVWNQFGEAVYKATVSYKIDEGTLHCQHGWWFPEQDGADHGGGCYDTFRSNVNNLIPNFHNGKLGFGAPCKAILCNIEPVTDNYDTDMAEIWAKFKREDQR